MRPAGCSCSLAALPHVALLLHGAPKQRGPMYRSSAHNTAVPPRARTCVRVCDAVVPCRYLVCGSDSASLYLSVQQVVDRDIVCVAQNSAVMDGLLTVSTWLCTHAHTHTHCNAMQCIAGMPVACRQAGNVCALVRAAIVHTDICTSMCACLQLQKRHLLRACPAPVNSTALPLPGA